MLLARLTEANANMAGQIRELTAPQDAPHDPESAPEASECIAPVGHGRDSGGRRGAGAAAVVG